MDDIKFFMFNFVTAIKPVRTLRLL